MTSIWKGEYMYGHAVALAALARPVTKTHRVLVQKVKEMYPRDDHPDLHEMHHPSEVQLWLRTTRFKQLASSYTDDEEWKGDEEIENILDILQDFKRAA